MDADHLRNLDYLRRIVFLLRRRCRLRCRRSALSSLAALLVRTIAALIRTTAALTRLTVPVIVEFGVSFFFAVIIAVLILCSAVF